MKTMKQWIKPLALITAISLLAGCAGGGASSSASDEAGGTAAEPYVPVYTYQNPDPDMVLISAPGGDITYENYRLYLDVTEGVARYSARQNLGLTAAVRYDLEENFGVEVDEEAFQQMASQEMLMAYYYSPTIFQNLPMVGEVSGLTEEQMSGALTETYRPQYLVNLLGNHFQQELEKDFPAAELPESASSGAEDGEAEVTAEQERQQKIFEAASQKMSEYSKEYDARLSLESDSETLLGTFDEIELPLTDSGREYIEYAAASSRVEAASFLQEGELALRALEARGEAIDSGDFAQTLESYRQAILEQELLVKELTRICDEHGATLDDYLKSLERPLWLQHTADLYYYTLNEEYNALDSGDRPDTFEEYFSTAINKALEGSELINVGG